MARGDRGDHGTRQSSARSDNGTSGGCALDASPENEALDGCPRETIGWNGMKKFALLLLALVVVSIPYVIAQQPVEVPALVPPAPVALVPTDHVPLPRDVSQYWFVPEAILASARSRGSLGNLARGVK